VQGTDFDELAFFRAIQVSRARALLIGRRVLVLLGLPVLTADYDFWIAIDDIAIFNDAAKPSGLWPTDTPEQARLRGRYALENDEHVDVLVARSIPTIDGQTLHFERLWEHRRPIRLAADVEVHIPTTADLIATKRIGSRPKDVEDIRLLELLARHEKGPQS
jgi:hypothetical protein